MATEDAPPTASSATEPTASKDFERRPFGPEVNGKRARNGVSYGPYREGHKPGGPYPNAEQILEDLRIVAKRWQLIRVYSSRGPTETILKTIRDNDLPLKAMVGAWIDAKDEAANEAEVAGAIRLANAYPDQVAAVSVGNETQVYWSGHRSPIEVLLKHLRKARAGVKQPVTTADDYNFWNKPESHAVADEVDFIVLHAYAMWNKQQLDDAVRWTGEIYASIQAEHPGITVAIGETGWATDLNPDGDNTKYIKAPAGEDEQAVFLKGFEAWAAKTGLTYFYFEAFDEPWKGGPHPREVEKHWGLYNVDRTPKKALRDAGAK